MWHIILTLSEEKRGKPQTFYLINYQWRKNHYLFRFHNVIDIDIEIVD